MNFLYACLKYSSNNIPNTLNALGHTVTVLNEHPFFTMDLENTVPVSYAEKAFRENEYDYAISDDFLVSLSDLCQKYHIPYIAWIYDSPMAPLFHNSVFNPVNRIFIFDSALCNRLKQIGIPHIYYMPLAANTAYADSLFTGTPEKFSHEISFVGSLYENNAYNEIRNKLPPEIMVPMNHYLMHMLFNYHEPRPWPTLPDYCVSFLLENVSLDTSAIDQYQIPRNMYLGLIFLSKKLAEMERIVGLNTLAEQFSVDLYTASSSDQVGILNVHPPVDYYTDLGKVYRFSKINLNFTLPSIETGIPMRIFNIMSYGGFVMSNYQKDIENEFTIGKDLVVFHDLDELKNLTAYYLAHEEERLQIAENGYRQVKLHCTYEKRLQEILSICAKISQEEQTL